MELVTCLWLTLIRLPLANSINIQYQIIIKYFKLCLNSFSLNYSRFMQYMKIDDGDGIISPLHLGMHSKTLSLLSNWFHVFLWFFLELCILIGFNYWILFVINLDYCLQTPQRCLQFWKVKSDVVQLNSYFKRVLT